MLLLGLVVVSILLLGLLGPGGGASAASRLSNVLITALSGGVLIAALRISGVRESHQRFYAGAVLVVLAMMITAVALGPESLLSNWLGFAWVLLVVSTPLIVLRRVIGAGVVTSQTIIGAISVFLLLGISFAYLIMAMDSVSSFFAQPIESTAYIYFAFVTMTTLGFGDLTPATDVARTTTIIFAVVGQFYLVMVFAKLVSVWRPDRQRTR